MRGEFIGVWSETWREIWAPLVEQDDISRDIYCELYREFEPSLERPIGEAATQFAINDPIQIREAFDRVLVLTGVEVDIARRETTYNSVVMPDAPNSTGRRNALETALVSIVGDLSRAKDLLSQALAELSSDPKKCNEAWKRTTESILNDQTKSEEVLRNAKPSDLKGERSVVSFLESVHSVVEDLGGDTLSNSYFNLLSAFIEKFSLRYDLRRPCTLCPTLPGVFTSLVRDLKLATNKDAHLNGLMKDYEEAIRDLRTDCSESRIKTCVVKQINLLEAMGSRFPGVTATTVGQICDQVGTWPHNSVKDAMKDLYKFSCNYPGIRHAGTPASALRVIEMRDMVAMSILLAGFMPYLTDQIDSNLVYRGA